MEENAAEKTEKRIILPMNGEENCFGMGTGTIILISGIHYINPVYGISGKL